jgi:hypothetical protein
MNLAPRGFCCSSKPRTIKGGVAAVAGTADDLVTDRFAAAALTVDLVDLLFRFVITGSPEKPKGPGEGAPVAVGLQVIGGSDRILSEQR